jgi:flagellar biosynthesis/type III secretory pathway protein FliH
VAAVFRFEQADSPATIESLIGLLIDWLADRPDLRRMFSLWIRATLMRKQNYGILLPQVDDLQEIKVMLADKLEQWALAYIAEGELKGKQEGIQEGKREGKREGKQEGEMLALQRLLSKRFGAIPADITRLISNAPVEAIERWFDQAIDAQKLSDIFKDD